MTRPHVTWLTVEAYSATLTADEQALLTARRDALV